MAVLPAAPERQTYRGAQTGGVATYRSDDKVLK